MFNRALLILPLLLAGASCVPPGAELASASAKPVRYVDLAAMDAAAATGFDVPPGYAAPSDEAQLMSATLPLIDPQAIAPGEPAKPFAVRAQAEPDQRRSLDCLTSAVYHEARSETEDGQRAVAQVVLNRVRHQAYPNSVCGVVYQGSTRRTGCQFSFTCDGSLARRVEPGAWERSRQIAAAALSGSVYDPVGLATHYHTTAVRPWWAASLTRAVTVGSHIFYRWRGSWGNPLSFRQTYAGNEPGAAPSIGSTASEADPVRSGPMVRIAALVDGGLRVNIHRGGQGSAPDQPVEKTGPVRIHRAAGSTPEPIGDVSAPAVMASQEIVSTQ
jgi:spore germination cell wall hydrolase CwlJ-like protein